MEPDKRRILSDRVLALVTIAVSVAMIIGSYYFRTSRYDMPASTAATFPRIIAVGMIILAIILYIQSAKREKKERAEGAEKYSVLAELKEEKLVIIMFLLITAYLALIKILGFMTATALFTVGSAILLGRGKLKIWVVVAVALGITISSYLIFCVLLHVVMPKGLLI